MTENEFSKSGQEILVVGKKYLCSRIDPIKEAKKWVAAQSALIHDSDYIIVLGIGSGYHIAELQQKYMTRKIIAIEFQQECYKFTQKKFPIELACVDLVLANQVSAVLSKSAMKDALKGYYCLVQHAPSVSLNPDKFMELKSHLVGRSGQTIKNLFPKETSRFEFLDSSDSKELLSIKHLDYELEKMNSLSNEDKLIVKMLRELIV